MDKTCADRVSDIVLEDLSVTFPVPGGTSQVLRHVSYTFPTKNNGSGRGIRKRKIHFGRRSYGIVAANSRDYRSDSV